MQTKNGLHYSLALGWLQTTAMRENLPNGQSLKKFTWSALCVEREMA
jgi:hypothetical protein